MTLILSLIGFLHSEASTAATASNIGTLSINTETVATELDNLSRNVFDAIGYYEELDLLHDASQSIYEAFLCILINLQDSVLAFQYTISAVTYNMKTLQLISGGQLHEINDKILLKTDLRLDFDQSTYQVKPVLVNNKLTVQLKRRKENCYTAWNYSLPLVP